MNEPFIINNKMSNTQYIRSKLNYIKNNTIKALTYSSTSDDSCMYHNDSEDNSFIYEPDEVVSEDSTSYYGRLRSSLCSTSSIGGDIGDGRLSITSPKTDNVSGAMNVDFRFSCENDRTIPNYMKYILLSNAIDNTAFALIKGLIDSNYFLAPFTGSFTDVKTTDTGVVPANLSDTSKCYVRNVYGIRNLRQNDESTSLNPYNVLSVILDQFNTFIDQLIENNWQTISLKEIENGWDSSNYSNASDNEDAANALTDIFFSKNTNGVHSVYTQFMITLLLPSVVQYLCYKYGTGFDEFFYYMGYIPSGQKVMKASGKDSLGILYSMEEHSTYSSIDEPSYNDSLTASDEGNGARWFSIAMNNSENDPLENLYESTITSIDSNNECKTTKPIYTFPKDMTVYSYLLSKYSKYFVAEVELVLAKMTYMPVLMKRFYQVCIHTGALGTKNKFDYVEPIIGFPIFRNEIKDATFVSACSKAISSTNYSNDDMKTVDLNKNINNVVRNIYHTESTANLLEGYAEAMLQKGDGHYAFMNLPYVLYDIEDAYSMRDSGDNEIYTDTSSLIDKGLYFSTDNELDSGTVESSSSSSSSDVLIADLLQYGITENSLELTTSYSDGSYITISNDTGDSFASRNTVRIAYDPTNVIGSGTYFSFIYDSSQVVQYIKEYKFKNDAQYTLKMEKEETSNDDLKNKILICTYEISDTHLPTYIINDTTE